MTPYQARFTKSIQNDLKKIKNNILILDRLQNKIKEVLQNPYHYKPLRNKLKNKRRVHVDSFVLIFEIIVKEKTVLVHLFRHHDIVYKQKE